MRILIFTLIVLLGGCGTPAHRADQLAAQAGLVRSVVLGDRFHHLTYARVDAGTPLLVYLDGDGLPWRPGGREISADPTVRHPLALDLAARSGGHSVLYLGRPCYFGLAALPECHPADWTSARYSADIVHSLAACANRFITGHGVRQVILIGHSGGGTLAVLMAPQVINLRAVITIAGNLDVKAWTAHHGYLPLTGSLDPADTHPSGENITEIHLTGERDTDVPPALLGGYLAVHPHAQHWRYPRFDHRCCWQEAWPELLPQLLQAALAPSAARGM
jgi:hypothetical protein